MENQASQHFFSDQALASFASAQGLTVQKVICHLWLNNTDQNAPLEIIDNVELQFSGGKKLTIGCDEQGEGLDVINFDFAATSKELGKEFGDKIRLFAVDASPTKMWQDVVGLVLEHVRITREEDRYRSDAIVLDFGSEKREISAAPLDGVIIDYFEE